MVRTRENLQGRTRGTYAVLRRTSVKRLPRPARMMTPQMKPTTAFASEEGRVQQQRQPTNQGTAENEGD